MKLQDKTQLRRELKDFYNYQANKQLIIFNNGSWTFTGNSVSLANYSNINSILEFNTLERKDSNITNFFKSIEK